MSTLLDPAADYYADLGILATASDDEIKAAFRRGSLRFHPDRNKSPDAETRFKRIAGAYEVLADSSRRLDYDRQRRELLRREQERRENERRWQAQLDLQKQSLDRGQSSFGEPITELLEETILPPEDDGPVWDDRQSRAVLVRMMAALVGRQLQTGVVAVATALAFRGVLQVVSWFDASGQETSVLARFDGLLCDRDAPGYGARGWLIVLAVALVLWLLAGMAMHGDNLLKQANAARSRYRKLTTVGLSDVQKGQTP